MQPRTPGQHAAQPLLLTLAEAAVLLHMSKTHVWRMTRAGDLPCIHFGRAVRIPRTALLDWITTNATC